MPGLCMTCIQIALCTRFFRRGAFDSSTAPFVEHREDQGSGRTKAWPHSALRDKTNVMRRLFAGSVIECSTLHTSLEGFTVKKRKSSVAPLLNCMCSVYKRTTGDTANLAMVYSTWLHVAASSLSASAAKNGPAAGGPTNGSFQIKSKAMWAEFQLWDNATQHINVL